MKTTAGLAVIFAVAAYKADLQIAAIFVASCVAGWVNVFGLMHALLAALRRRPVGRVTMLVIAGAILCDILLVLSGYGLVLTLATACALLIDAIVLRFAGPPIGHQAQESEP